MSNNENGTMLDEVAKKTSKPPQNALSAVLKRIKRQEAQERAIALRSRIVRALPKHKGPEFPVPRGKNEEVVASAGEDLTEIHDLRRFETLVRMGMLPVEKIPIIRRAFESLDTGKNPSQVERTALFEVVNTLMFLLLGDSAIFNRARANISSGKFVHEDVDTIEDETELSEAYRKFVAARNELIDVCEGNFFSTNRSGVRRQFSSQQDATRWRQSGSRKYKMRSRFKKTARKTYRESLAAGLVKFNVTDLTEIPKDQIKEFFAFVDSHNQEDTV